LHYQKRGKVTETGVNIFNQKPSAGIDYLVTHGVINRTPEEVARFIRSKAGELSKRRVGEFVGNADPFGQEVLRLLLQDYDFAGMALDQALRVRLE
jgi:Sec7-like guanine-nucleotide exchange factor